LPLVLTGTSLRLSAQKTVVATKKGVTVRMPVRVFNFKSKNSRVDKRKEFTAVARNEVALLENRYQRSLEKRITTHRDNQKTQV
jgi:hypothetical protein